MAALAGLGEWLDSVVSEGFSKLNYSVILSLSKQPLAASEELLVALEPQG